MDSKIDRLVVALRERVGDGLRGVFYGKFREREYSVAYTSEEALDDYSAEQIDDIIDDVAFKNLHSDRKADLHEPLGRYTTSVEVFDDGINLVVLGYDGLPTVFVGMDSDVSNVTPALEAVESVLE
ncbi:hypothetical protein [Halorussus pelagicus]|uniref:hypothetical protein n=1 Tax=Halorussus pelagicus TaxID=2505977 RepID=UPI000FFB9405|nr:hypothetical protein [Halorussus pelagicus]